MIMHTIKSLLIEDDTMHAELITGFLCETTLTKISVELAENFQRARQLILANKYDIILTDLSLPDSMHNHTLGKVKSIARETPIVVLTSFDDPATIRGMILDGAEDCIPKTQLNPLLLERVIMYSIDRYGKRQTTRQRTSELEKTNTSLKESEDRLYKNNVFLQSVLDAIPDPIYAKAISGSYAMINRKGAEFFRKSEEDIIGKNDRDLFLHEIATMMMKQDDRIVHSKMKEETFEEYLESTGIVHTFLTAKCPILMETERLPALLALHATLLI